MNKVKKLVLITILALLLSNSIKAKSIGGIINSYFEAINIKSNVLTLNTTNNINIGDRFLIIQMKGVLIDSSNTSNFGNIINYKSCGNFEYNEVKGINNNEITLKNNLKYTFDPNGIVQLVIVPVYDNVNITSELTCQKWDGKTGGILALEVLGNLTLNADINTSGKGFLGANHYTTDVSGRDQTDYYYPFGDTRSGAKGEGIYNLNYDKQSGRGKQSSGGGGGNGSNSGGGGGGSIGKGGKGGWQWSGYGNLDIGGLGGLEYIYNKNLEKIFLGGGGGTGDDNDGTGKNGGDGGAIIYIIAKNLIPNNFKIVNNGNNAQLVGKDGGSGGGAGGFVLLKSDQLQDNIQINAKGGKGSDNDNHPLPESVCHAPGGGGGGGLIYYSGNNFGKIIGNVDGGLPGLLLDPNCNCGYSKFGQTYGNENGKPGIIESGDEFHFNILTTLDLIINIYKPVTAFDYCENSITVSNTDSLKVGDKVLMIQMQGALIDTTNTAKFGDITDIRSAGLYEFGFIKQIINNRIIFNKKMINKYNLDGNVQIVTVPIYNNLQITNTLTAQNWDGKTGGILVFEADSIFMKTNIDVSGKGFRGGIVKKNPIANQNNDFYVSSEIDQTCARKGEGISVLKNNFNSGRGKNANGGGGGNPCNAGGGGGSNIGTGGQGGNTWSGWGTIDYGGKGGISLTKFELSKRFFCGGGGGAGEGNENTETNGENGGGIIIIKSNNLISNGFKIISKGYDALDAGNDGAGGGGGGGFLSMSIQKTDNINADVSGGNGGNNNNGPIGYTYCHAPGGGGGGGIIQLLNFNVIADINSNINKGNAGKILNTISSCGNLSKYGATDGENGNGLFMPNIDYVQQTLPFVPLNQTFNINDGKYDIYLCNTDSLKLDITPFDKDLLYNWSNGQKGTPIYVKKSGLYSCTISNGLCSKVATCNVNLIPKMNFKIIKKEYSSGCGIDSIKLNVNPNPSDFIYGWNTLETNSSITVSKTGKYKVYIRSKDANFNCIDSLEIDVLIDSKAGSTNSLVIDDENKIISLDTVYSNLIDCRNLRIKNISDKSILINDKSFNINKQFSLPSSQFPLIIKAKDSISLVYCFSSLNSGIYRDTLMINDECSPHKLKFISYSIIPDKSGNNKCGNDYELKFNKILKEKNILFKTLFPNPTNNFIHIDFEEDQSDTTSNIYNTFEYCIYSIIGSKIFEKRFQIENNHNSIILDIGFLSLGNYYLLIKHNESERVYWFIKE